MGVSKVKSPWHDAQRNKSVRGWEFDLAALRERYGAASDESGADESEGSEPPPYLAQAWAFLEPTDTSAENASSDDSRSRSHHASDADEA